MRVLRAHLTYANVAATIAVVLALGGTSYAAFRLPNNSVKSTTIKNHEVKTQDLATSAVTTSKIAAAAITNATLGPASVSTNNLVDNAVTGDKTNESTLGNFGCGGLYQAGNGLCAFRTDSPTALTWAQAVARCTTRNNDAVLPTMGQIQAISTQTNSPFTSMTVWTADAAGGNTNPMAYVVGVSSTNVTSANPLAISDSAQITQVACVFDPASKAG